ncbi:MAG: hypothetical protein NT145_05925 [Elusimicrobia bacterium]|nr:hypothetical protein [Elusimicrobiota bacterium]
MVRQAHHPELVEGLVPSASLSLKHEKPKDSLKMLDSLTAQWGKTLNITPKFQNIRKQPGYYQKTIQKKINFTNISLFNYGFFCLL